MMKPEDIQNALGDIGEDLINEAATAQKSNKKFKKRKWIPAIAAMLTVAILVGVLFRPTKFPSAPSESTGNGNLNVPIQKSVHVIARYPVSARHYRLFEMFSEDRIAAKKLWDAQKKEQKALFDSVNPDFDPFFNDTMLEILTESNGENRVYSPLSVYMALSLLAETCDENSRKQILDLLRMDSVEDLRSQINALWRSHYIDDGVNALTLGNSLWLNNKDTYNKEVLKTLADQYFASSYLGNPTDEEYVQLFRDWLNEQTHGLLKNNVDQQNFSSNMVVKLASIIYFKAGWEDEFHTNINQQIFHAKNGDISTTFMSKDFSGLYYKGTLFSAVPSDFQDGGMMWLILPNENVELDTVLRSEEYREFLTDPSSKCSYRSISLSVPKFDISCETDLIPVLKKLGITDVFDKGLANFSNFTDTPNVYVSDADQCTRVKIDEQGCEAAAFTTIEATDTGVINRTEIVFDRPFLFVIASEHNIPLFSGVVNDPTAS